MEPGIDERRAYFEAARERTPYLAVSGENGTFVIRTDDFGVGRSLYAGQSRSEFRMVGRVVEVLAERGHPLPPDSVFVDVGANIGTSLIPALLRHGFARAVAIEPVEENHRTLRMSLIANGLEDRVDVVEAGASDVAGTVAFHINLKNSGAHEVARDVHRLKDRQRVLPVVTLDGLVEEGRIDPATVGLVWLDAQGQEGHILAGAKKLLEARVPMLLELSPRHLGRAEGIELLRTAVASSFSQIIDMHDRDRTFADAVSGLDELLERLGQQTKGAFTDVLLLP